MAVVRAVGVGVDGWDVEGGSDDAGDAGGVAVGVLVAPADGSAGGPEDEADGTAVGAGSVPGPDGDPREVVPEALGPAPVTPTPPTMPPAAARLMIDRTTTLPAVAAKSCVRLWDPVRPAGTVGNPWYTLGG